MTAEPVPLSECVASCLAERHRFAYRRMTSAESSAPDARARLAAAMVYLRDVVATAPAEVLEAAERNVRASVMDAVAAVTMLAELAACAHPAADWCADPGCYARHWRDPAAPGRVIPLDHRHCPDCQGTERAGRWSL